MPKKMLVADKSIVIQKSIGITFAQEDYAITYANDGEEALSKARQLKPDIALVHTGTAKKSGYDVCEALRQDPQTSAIPVLLLVGTQEAFDESRGQAVGASGFMIKPFESQVLIDKVNELLAKRGAPATQAAPTRPAAPMSPPSPSPPAPAASPAATIAGRSPLPPSTPSPAATIAGRPSVPPATPQVSGRDAPMLDLDVSVEEPTMVANENAFEFSFDDASSSPTSTSAEPTVAMDMSAPEPAAEQASGDIWNFGDQFGGSAPEAEPSPVESQPTSLPEEPTFDFSGQSDDSGVIDLGPPASADTPSFDFGDTSFAPEPNSETPSEIVESSAFEFAGESPSTEISTDSFAVEGDAPEPTPEIVETPLELRETAPVPAVAPSNGANLNLSEAQIQKIVSQVFQTVIERIAWEVVPDIAERIIREEIARLTQEKS